MKDFVLTPELLEDTFGAVKAGDGVWGLPLSGGTVYLKAPDTGPYWVASRVSGGPGYAILPGSGRDFLTAVFAVGRWTGEQDVATKLKAFLGGLSR